MSVDEEITDKVFLLSLQQDLDIFKKIIDSLTQVVSKDNIHSWLFPTKHHSFIDKILLERKENNFSYVQYLEFLIDRCYTVVNLILTLTKSKLDLKETNKYICIPRQVTFGFSFDLLWNCVSNLTDKLTAMDSSCNKESSSIYPKLNRRSQTDITSINKCDSCATAISCMKNILHTFEENAINRVSEEKESLKLQIYDITQFGSMLKSTSTVERSLNLLFEKLKQLTRENDNIKMDNMKLHQEIDNRKSIVSLLEREISIFRGKSENDRNQLMKLTSSHQNLLIDKTNSDLRIKMLEEIVENYNTSIRKYKGNYETERMQTKKFTQCFQLLNDKQRIFHEIITKLTDKVTEIEEIQNVFMEEMKILDSSVGAITKNIEKIDKACRNCEFKLHVHNVNLHSQSFSLETKFDEFQKNLVPFVESLKMNDHNSPPFKVQGNPVEDMNNQIEENNKKIQMLEQENCKLNNLLSKLTLIKK